MESGVQKQDNVQDVSQNLSLLMDGELSEQEVNELLAQNADHDLAFIQWGTYHLIGDVLRSNEMFLETDPTISAQTLLHEFRARVTQECHTSDVVSRPSEPPRKNVWHWLRLPPWGAGLAGISSLAIIMFVCAVMVTFLSRKDMLPENTKGLTLSTEQNIAVTSSAVKNLMAHSMTQALNLEENTLQSSGVLPSEQQAGSDEYLMPYMTVHQQTSDDLTHNIKRLDLMHRSLQEVNKVNAMNAQ